MSSTELVFGYGSNMDLKQMEERCPNSKLQPFIAEARGWRLCFPRKSDKRRGGVGSIVRDPGESVWGVVFHVAQGDLPSLDRREGVFLEAYHREKLEVFGVDGKPQMVSTYFAVPQDNPPKHYLPHQDYIALYLRGADKFHLPSAYQDKLKRIETSKT